MNKAFHKNVKNSTIVIKSQSEKTFLFYTGLGFFIATQFPWVLYPFGGSFSNAAKILAVLSGVISSAIFCSSFWFKHVTTIFDHSSGLVTFHSSKLTFDVPFSLIRFVTNRLMSTKGSSIAVSVYAVSNKPLHSRQKITNPDKSADHYETLLCTYNCHGQEEADESIEQLQRFMGVLPPEPEESEPSKFDKLK